ncbi:MAG: UPF0182 family protein [Desulfitobacterium hafniense]|nr:UPF0182 family protein [Desulfitobacterium hafniense]
MNRFSRGIVVLAIVTALLSASSGLYEDWLWFKDLGYPQLFWTPLLSKWIIQAVNGTILFIFIAGTLLSIRHAIVTFVNERLRSRLRLVHDMDRPVLTLSQRRVTVWLIVISAVISLAVSFVAGFTGWLDVLSFFHSTQFGKADPIFGKDLSFYIFQLPFFITLYNAFYGPLFLLTLLTGVFYVVTGVLRFHSLRLWRQGAIEIGPAARKHLALLVAVLFAFRTFGYFLNMYQLLYSKHGQVIGPGYTDLYATLPALKILIVLSIIGLFAAVLGIIFRDSRLLTLPVTTVFIMGTVLYVLFPSLIQSFIVTPNELAKEAPYIANEIAMTRYAYGLDKIQEQDYPGNKIITAEILKAEQATLNNIRLNDTRPMLQTYTQKQGIRLYYKFNDIDVDRYTVNGEYRQVMLAARELSTPDLDANAKTFINLRFKYTHGFGVSASFANAVTPEGLPAFAVKDVPPVTDYPEFKLTEPRIYYGELTNDWVVVNTTNKEFDYPQGNVNAENNYQGKTGIFMSPLNKFMLSLKHGTLRFYLSGEVNSQSKILLHRNIKERVQKLVPFLKFDSDPYMVIDNDRVKWIMDAYTTSNTMPYSREYGEQNFNYIRNSVKIIIDGYDGTVDFYTSDKTDPIIKTYQSIFPGVFKEVAEMPSSLKSHLRYPETMFTIQSNMLKIFHMTNPTVFYNKEDAWDIAKELFGAKPQNVDPYYTVMKIPGEANPEFVLMLPFTPASSATNTRNNMIAWMAARMDGDNYGQLLLYKLPKNIEIDGPLQIESRIDQDPEISRQLTLWDQKGSSVIRGNLLAMPIGGNFLFVEPIYLQSDKGGSIPEMKRVIVAYQDQLVMTETLGEALTNIFGQNAPQPTTPGQSIPVPSPARPETKPVEPIKPSENISQLIDQINQIRSMLENLENQLKGLQTAPEGTRS